MENIEEELKERVLRLRKEAGYSQEALATQAGISSQTVKDIENGRKGAGIRVVQRLSKAFDISMEELIGEMPPVAKKVQKIKIRSFIKAIESVPDNIYELAMGVPLGHDVWGEIEHLLRVTGEGIKKINKENSEKLTTKNKA